MNSRSAYTAAALALLLTEGTGPTINYNDIREKGEPIRLGKAPGRNEPCPCGSGKKYKKCHMNTDPFVMAAEIGKYVVARTTGKSSCTQSHE